MLIFSNRSQRSLPCRRLGLIWAWHRWQRTTATVLLLGLAVAPSAIAQERLPRVLSVTGQGTERIQTTLTRVQLGVEVDGKTAQQVQAEVARRSEAVVTLLRSRQVEKLETTGINLSPKYRFTGNTQELIGYQGQNTISFRVPTERAGPILDAAVGAGATRIDGISFMASDAAIAQAQLAALKSATQNARDQAKAVLSSLDLTPKGIVGIQINGAPLPQPFPLARGLPQVAAEASPTTPVIGGEQEVQASVTLQISY